MQNKTKLEITEVKYIRSSSRKKNEQKRIHRIQRIVSTAVVLLCCAFLVLGGINVVSSNTSAYQIVVDGEVVATMTSAKEADATLERFLAEKSEELGFVAVVGDEVQIVQISSKDAVYTSSKDALASMDENLAIMAYATAIYINGEPSMYVADHATATLAMNTVKNHYASLNGPVEEAEVAVVQQVSVHPSTIIPEQVLTADEATNMLLFGNKDVEFHFVEAEGETFEYIANRFGVSVDEIQAANPLLDSTNLPLGAAVKLTSVEPMVSVQVKRTVVVTEEVAFETENRDNYELMRSEENILVAGVPGQAEVTKEVIERNGEVIEELVLASVTVVEPVTQVVERGAQLIVASRGVSPLAGSLPTGDGYVGNPFASGRLESRYGPRWTSFHSGLDISGPTGSPIAAAEAGTVILSDWYYDYGNAIIIDHGDGMTTLYGHCSELYVNVGEYVERGQNIAAVGNTGRSTGPHVHFEIMFDGYTADPLLYISF